MINDKQIVDDLGALAFLLMFAFILYITIFGGPWDDGMKHG